MVTAVGVPWMQSRVCLQLDVLPVIHVKDTGDAHWRVVRLRLPYGWQRLHA